jgi:hypothetical protein
LLSERGYEVTKRDDDSLSHLGQRLQAVEDELRGLRERKDPETTFAEGYAKALDQSRSKWYSPGDREGGPDAA